jgi:site-specific DNA recombinase
MRTKPLKPEAAKVVRCAIYTRKSSEENLELEFNSLDAQRESAEAFIASQKGEGWVGLDTRYDDGGYTGGNMERPALIRLLADITAGKIDIVIVYKVDRLSRSLLDFGRIVEVFERHGVSFVSVTQQINSGTSMGRLMLNVLLSFAQFEREIIGERTRDKIAATRRKGKWSGGRPLLGYDVHSSPAGSKLVVNEEEARQVVHIYKEYLRYEALIPTLKAIQAKGWTNKRWTTKGGKICGGRPFDKGSLYALLTNRTYLGLTTYKDEAHRGEHEAIIEKSLWERVRATLSRNGHTSGAGVRNKYGALLTGLLRCSCCDCSMIHSYSVKEGGKRYRYYVCTKAQKHGWDACPSKSIPAAQIENFVVGQIRRIGNDESLLRGTLRQMQKRQAEALDDLRAEQKSVAKHLARLRTVTPSPDALAEIQRAERKAADLHAEVLKVEAERIDPTEVAEALAAFDPLWQQLSPKEQARVIRLLIDHVDYDGANGTVSVTFHPSGIKALAQEQLTEVAA